MKDSKKGGDARNYRPTACLPITWKLLAAIIQDKIYGLSQRNSLLQNEQKGCHREFREIKDQLLLNKTILRYCRKTKRNLALEFIDYKKENMMPHSWLKEKLKIVGVAGNICRLLSQSMCNWKTVLTSNKDTLGESPCNAEYSRAEPYQPSFILVCPEVAW